MFVPFISEPKRIARRRERRERERLERRKGGGGGRGGGGGGRGGSGSGSSSGGGIRQQSTSFGGTQKTTSAYSSGGGAATTISSGLFAGRQQGGGTRQQVYGTSQYGSGYPNQAGRGVDGRGFPFYFWPIGWGGLGFGGAAYLHTNQYGRPNNSSRPGGVMSYANFPSNAGNTTFFVVSDRDTVASLITDLSAECGDLLDKSKLPGSPIAYQENNTNMPQPESTVQYYRASSVSLTLDGYNNTGALQAEGTPDTPIPSYVNQTLLTCMNETIGEAAPLVDADSSVSLIASPHLGSIGLLSCIIYFLS
ncbi:hypothetical protein CYLTODRAFT_484686 [Cylindrobasidium torrendii FP15055 ss-10]|uniref:Uncharacterized protein n=1 Tax=Cylindrobasidium torrendii FP15055 ss-10 TaxID=1314674 RepID=A0A0D7BVU9_9AGAR|nr:hypothetical protein CYLTODRAFT_484686 [Cylindrobasidium torrendii FP15055 ss-10]